MGFAKIYDSLWNGSLRGKGEVILVWVNLLTHASADGVVDITPRVISDETGLPVKHVYKCLQVLMAPDSESRSSENEGRRLLPLDDHRSWGWLIVNYAQYRATHGDYESKSRVQARLRQATKRATDVLVSISNVTHEQSRDCHEFSASASVLCTEGTGVLGIPGKGEESMEELQVKAVNACMTSGVPDDFARMVFSYWYQREGRDGNGNNVPWIRYVCSRWVREQVEWKAGNHREQLRGKNNGSPPAPAHIQLRVVEEQIKDHKANPQSRFYDQKCTDLEKAAYRALRIKRDELKMKITAA